MVWGCFSACGVWNVCRIEGIMRKEDYNNILRNEMLTSARRLFGENEWIFQQNNDPKHTAKVNKEWVQSNNIKTFAWPSQSPDLNPIENLWSLLDKRCAKRQPNNENELFQILQKAWLEVPINILHGLVSNMLVVVKLLSIQMDFQQNINGAKTHFLVVTFFIFSF